MITEYFDICHKCELRFNCAFERVNKIAKPLSFFDAGRCVRYHYDAVVLRFLLDKCGAIARYSTRAGKDEDKDWVSGIYIYFKSEEYYKIFIRNNYPEGFLYND